MRIPSGSNNRQLAFVAKDDTGARVTGLTGFTVYRSRNGGTATAYTTPTIAEASAANMPGLYWLTVDEDTTIDAGADEQEYVVHITHASMEPVTRAVELYRPKITEGNTAGVNASGHVDRVTVVDTCTANTDMVAEPDNAGIAAIQAQTDLLAFTGTDVHATLDGEGVTVSDKTGFKLAADGLDSIATTAPAGVASNFREMVVQTWRRLFKKATFTTTQLKTYADNGTDVLTTQTVSDSGGTQTQGEAS
jgi:hypothetical protein